MEDHRNEKYVVLFGILMVARIAANGGERKQCYKITIPMCKGVGYNFTYMPNEFNHGTQDEAGLEVHQFWPLVEINCSPDMKFFLCSMYTPICMDNYTPHLPACRSVCERAKSGCAPLMRQYDFSWPKRMDCGKLPYYGEKGKLCMDRNITNVSSAERTPKTSNGRSTSKPVVAAIGDARSINIDARSFGSEQKDTMDLSGNSDPNIKDQMNPHEYHNSDNTCVCTCRLQTIHASSSYYNKISTGGINNCAMNCTSPYLTDDEKTIASFWIGLWSVLCCMSTLLTILTYVIDVSRFKYPERPIIFLSGCYFMVSIGYIIRMIAGHDIVACDGSMIRYSTTGPVSCVSTFLLIYFFGMASSIWWVVLSFTWFLSVGLKWGSEAISNYSQYFHFAAWLIPSVKSIAVLAISGVDGDSIAGICYVGNQSSSNLLGFVLIPLFVYLIIGSTFLIAGFVSLCRIRNVIKHQNGRKIEKLERLMIRIGLFSLLETIPATIVLGCYLYEQHLKDEWEKSINCPCFSEYREPDFAVYTLKYFMLFVVGITSGFWIWTSKTVDTWKKFCSGTLCCKNSEYAYAQPPIKYPPTSASVVSSFLDKPPPVGHC